MNTQITINGVALDFDVLELESAEEYEKAKNKVVKKTEGLKQISPKNENIAWVIKTTCRAIFEFFDSVCGEGTAKRIFGDRTNLADCMNAFYSFNQQTYASIQALADQFKAPAAQVKK